ncbi:MAG: cupin domain-containing protein [Armatimonadetes bacterium]|nr:cupin domain-containing protein [Armatimonadota bacterium]
MRRLLPIAAALCLGLAAAVLIAREAQPDISVHQLANIVKANPIDPATGRNIATVGSGVHTTVTVWQVSTDLALHYHREHDEVVYCQSGEGIARLGNETRRMKAGEFIIIPPGVVHGVKAVGKKPMRGLSIFGPLFDGKDRVPVAEGK